MKTEREAANGGASPAMEGRFKRELVALIPQLRAFARTLTGDQASADDLAQDALMKAWDARASYQMGTNMKAWTFMILRNQFYSEKRRSWRSSALDPETAERTLVAVTSETGGLELDELRRALGMLPEDQREALILVGAAGLSYERGHRHSEEPRQPRARQAGADLCRRRHRTGSPAHPRRDGDHLRAG
jgi:RNA polymerase sigma-70 factor (ECF subfamily)